MIRFSRRQQGVVSVYVRNGVAKSMFASEIVTVSSLRGRSSFAGLGWRRARECAD